LAKKKEILTMPLIINTNVASLSSQRFLTNNTNALNKSLERLSSGYRINRGADDAAGLQLSENLRAQIRGSQAALGNVQDGINLLNIADGGLSVITENIQRMRELAVQAANDTYDANQRTALNQEFDARAADITRISAAVEFNGVTLLNASAAAAALTLQVGPNNTAGVDTLAVGATAFNTASDAVTLGIGAAATALDTNANANTAIGLLDTALTTVNGRRATIGSFVNQLESAAQNLAIGVENLSASESRVRNVDVAAESANLTRNQILQQASAAMLSQANQSPSLALSLLK